MQIYTFSFLMLLHSLCFFPSLPTFSLSFLFRFRKKRIYLQPISSIARFVRSSSSRASAQSIAQSRNRCRLRKDGTLHNRKVFADALFLLLLNVGNSIIQVKNMVEVDTAGRYNICPVQCAEGRVPSRTLYGCNIYQRSGYRICLFTCMVSYDLIARTSRR